MTEKFIIGQVGAPFGIKGFVKVHSFSGETEHLLKLQSVIISMDGKERVIKIEESTPASPSVLMRFAGIDTPEAAKALNGALLIASRDQAAPLGKGEFYIEDLKGLQVITEDGEPIGCITDIIEGGGGDLAEIKLTSGEKRLVPFREEFLTRISPQCGTEKGKVVLQNLWIIDA
jgi:16S rRNA processing protein RimM